MADFWDDTEIGLYTQEALRVWNALTHYYRERMVFQTVYGQSIYDLSKVTFNPATTAFTRSATDYDLIRQIQYHLLEPVDASAWTGTSMFTLEEVLDAVQSARDQFLSESGCRLTHSQEIISPPPAGRTLLPDSILDIRRVAFQLVGSTWSTLGRDDEHFINAFSPGWNINPAAPPSVYSVLASPPFTLQLAPPPLDTGTLDLLSVAVPNQFVPGQSSNLGVPDDYSWAVKYGALHRLLSADGPARDALRADYCLSRYRQGIQLAKNCASVLFAEIQGIPLHIDDLHSLDNFAPNWMNVLGQPTTVAVCGYNILALSPVPNGVYSITLDAVRSAPVPTYPADPINIDRSCHETITAYAQHIASFKQGGQEFLETVPLLDRMIKHAQSYNRKIQASGVSASITDDLAQKYGRLVPARVNANAAD